jgi:hypothetical protein
MAPKSAVLSAGRRCDLYPLRELLSYRERGGAGDFLDGGAAWSVHVMPCRAVAVKRGGVQCCWCQVPHADPIAMMDLFEGVPPPSMRGRTHLGYQGVTYLLDGAYQHGHGEHVAGDVLYYSGGAVADVHSSLAPSCAHRRALSRHRRASLPRSAFCVMDEQAQTRRRLPCPSLVSTASRG